MDDPNTYYTPYTGYGQTSNEALADARAQMPEGQTGIEAQRHFDCTDFTVRCVLVIGYKVQPATYAGWGNLFTI